MPTRSTSLCLSNRTESWLMLSWSSCSCSKRRRIFLIFFLTPCTSSTMVSPASTILTMLPRNDTNAAYILPKASTKPEPDTLALSPLVCACDAHAINQSPSSACRNDHVRFSITAVSMSCLEKRLVKSIRPSSMVTLVSCWCKDWPIGVRKQNLLRLFLVCRGIVLVPDGPVDHIQLLDHLSLWNALFAVF